MVPLLSTCVDILCRFFGLNMNHQEFCPWSALGLGLSTPHQCSLQDSWRTRLHPAAHGDSLALLVVWNASTILEEHNTAVCYMPGDQRWLALASGCQCYTPCVIPPDHTSHHCSHFHLIPCFPLLPFSPHHWSPHSGLQLHLQKLGYQHEYSQPCITAVIQSSYNRWHQHFSGQQNPLVALVPQAEDSPTPPKVHHALNKTCQWAYVQEASY